VCGGIGRGREQRRKNAGASWMKPTATGVLMGRRRRKSRCETGEMGCRRRCEGAGGALEEITRLWQVSSCSSAPSRGRPVVSCAGRDSEVRMAWQRAEQRCDGPMLLRGGSQYLCAECSGPDEPARQSPDSRRMRPRCFAPLLKSLTPDLSCLPWEYPKNTRPKRYGQ
jgi:hypothetical protein